MGARLLPQVPKPPQGLHRELLEVGELGRGESVGGEVVSV